MAKRQRQSITKRTVRAGDAEFDALLLGKDCEQNAEKCDVVGWGFTAAAASSAPFLNVDPGVTAFNARTFPKPPPAEGAVYAKGKKKGQLIPDKVDVCRVGIVKAGCLDENGDRIDPPKGKPFTDMKACRAAGGVSFTPRALKDLRRDKVELDFISDEQASAYGFDRGGAFLRMCQKAKQRGVVIPVSDPADAQERAQAYSAGVENPRADTREAAFRVAAGRKYALAGTRRRSSKTASKKRTRR